MSDEPADAPQTPGQFLEAAYVQHAAACRLYAHQIIGGKLAEDACQEAFIRLFRQVVRGGGAPRAPRAWLLMATRSAALDLFRSEKRRRRREEIAGRDEPFAKEPGAAIEAGELAAALAQLPQRQREVIVLRIWGELGFADIAEMLGVAISTAHADCTTGLAALRQKLDPEAASIHDAGHKERTISRPKP